jgi:hypothetical protein
MITNEELGVEVMLCKLRLRAQGLLTAPPSSRTLEDYLRSLTCTQVTKGKTQGVTAFILAGNYGMLLS